MTFDTTPEIVELCARLQANDPSLTDVDLIAVPCVTVGDAVDMLQALQRNTVVTHLELCIPQDNGTDRTGGEVTALLLQLLQRPDCPIQSLVVTCVHGAGKKDHALWYDVFHALQSNHSVTKFEVGLASAMFDDTEALDVLDERACQQLSTALSQSNVEDIALRHFHITSKGLLWLVQGLKATKCVELHQILCETNLFHHLSSLCDDALESLTIHQCRCTQVDDDGADSFIGRERHKSERTATVLPESSLHTLRIMECNEADKFLPALFGAQCMRSLQTLDLRDTNIHGPGIPSLAKWIGTLNHLEKLVLEGCGLTEHSVAQILEPLTNHEHIRKLNLQRNRLAGLSPDSFSLPLLPPNPVSMNVSQNENVGDSTWLPSVIASNPQVQKWFLGSTGMSTLGLKALCLALSNIPEPSKITLLSLKANNLMSEGRGVQLLSGMLHQRMPCLEELDLAGCALDNDDVACLSNSLKGHPSLSKLCIQFNKFDNEACPILAEAIAMMPHLHSLDMQFGKYDKQGLVHFIPALKANTRICHFNFWTHDFSFSQEETRDIEKTLSLWLCLNKSGRQVSQENISVNLIPNVLERALWVGKEQGLYCIIQENVDRVIGSE